MQPNAPIEAPIIMKIICRASIHKNRRLNTRSNMMMTKLLPRYMVPQKITTPMKHMMVAIRVAYGIRVTHDLQQPPGMDTEVNFNIARQ